MARLAALLMAFIAGLLSAQTRYTVESSQFIPQSYYVGDRVELRIVLRTAGGFHASSLRELPKISWGELHGARITPRDDKLEIRLTFTAYQPGTQTLPALQFGDIGLEGLKVNVRSLVDEGHRDPAQPRGPLLLPSTRLIIGLVVGGFLALPLIGVFLFVWVRPRIARLIARYQERRPYRRFQKAVKALRDQIPDLDGRRFYIALLDQMKIYLSHRFGGDCAAYTTRELEEYFIRGFGDGPEKERLLRIFMFGDEVKFGGRGASRERRSEDAAAAAEISAALEHKDRGHADL